ncbi:Ger(x)C family spore germination protein [Paenibacillus roseipurpureus]|uniref:Ger(X)C family spore germination protein n=1 Tax=Paenibacillus roseopurpureus TaxID=2918901 RepID=A0AA96RN98_9BACL|nr:Ger(x)C family spore germination protein [Paenibacillus sp. MBLB1832]WNR45202.1 Ger(x)C family spore germination protein [Paenibacillus sp. MBLB1832]
MMRFIILLLALILTSTLLGGCGFKDIDKRFFVVAMGIDWTGKKDKPYLVTLRLAIPASKVGEGLAESQIERQEAENIAEAVRNLKAHVDKEIDFGHCRVFLFGDSLVKETMNEPMNWLSRRRDIQLISYTAVAEPSASKLLASNPTTERLAGNSFFLTFGKEGTVSPYTVTEPLFDSFRRFKEKGMDPYLPVVSFDGDSYVVEHLALLDKMKQRLVLTPAETQLYNMSANEFSRAGIPITYEDEPLSFYVSGVHRNISISHDEIPVVKMTLNLKGIIEQARLNVNTKEVQRLLEKHVNERVEALLYKIRNAGVDPYGFGLHYLGQYFGKEADYAHWQSVYPEVTFKVETHVKIESTGLVH